MEPSLPQLKGLIVRLKEVVEVWPPVSEVELRLAEQKLGGHVPADLAQFYRQLDGTKDETPPEHGWIHFWPVQMWKSVREVLAPLSQKAEDTFRHVLGAAVFAEYCQESWWYAVELSSKRRLQASIYLIDGWEEPLVVATHFNAFLATVLVDGPEMYRRH